jgi:adenylate cyclase class 2
MPYLNVEIKAHCQNPEYIREYLKNYPGSFKGVDEQTDTYFSSPNGRLKLREGNIENNLIYYERENKPGFKHSHFQLVKVEDAKGLKQVLMESMGVKVIVKKRREIYYIDNVKFHIDEVPGLGSFMEIEAGNILADLSKEKLQEQCDFYMSEFGIRSEDIIDVSYSDMLLQKFEKGVSI